MQKRKQKFSVYKNFDTDVSTHIDGNPGAVLLMSSNDFNVALAYAEEYSDENLGEYIAVIDNREGEAYYSSSPPAAVAA